MLSIKEGLKRDYGLEVRISGGSGKRDDPFVLEACRADEAALSQLLLLRGIGLGSGPWFWRMFEWSCSPPDGDVESVLTKTVLFSSTEIVRTDYRIYFDTREVSGLPHKLHPLSAWRGPAGSPVLPYELGWLHFDGSTDNSAEAERFDHSIAYSGPGAKATVFIYERSQHRTREDELQENTALLLKPGVTDPWPERSIGPFVVKFVMSGKNLLGIAVASCGPYFVKLRLTFFDDPSIRSMMGDTIRALADAIHAAQNVRN